MEIKKQVKKEAKLQNLPLVELNEKELSAVQGGAKTTDPSITQTVQTVDPAIRGTQVPNQRGTQVG